mgnify:CR=1 FL=1
MTGTRLEVEMYLVTVQATAAQNVRKSVQRAGYRVAELVLEPLAASYAVLTDDEKELGVGLVDVGGGSTGVAVFHDGKIRHIASIQFAGHAGDHRPGARAGRDADRRRASQGATGRGVRAAGGRVGDDRPAVHARTGPAAGGARAVVEYHLRAACTRSSIWWGASSSGRGSAAGGCRPVWC